MQEMTLFKKRKHLHKCFTMYQMSVIAFRIRDGCIISRVGYVWVLFSSYCKCMMKCGHRQ